MKKAQYIKYGKLIRALNEKNYSDADKYLQGIIQDKIKSKIEKCSNKI